MKKAHLLVGIGAIAALVLAGCGEPPEKKDDAGTSGADSDFKACMVSDAGGFDDKSFNQSSYEGLEKAEKDLGIKKEQLESKDNNDFGPNLDSMMAAGCKITVTVGFNLADATKETAEANTDAKFTIVDDASIELPNVKPIVYATQEATFLAGYLAAGYSKTGKVGTFGGMAIPSVTIFMDGFADGVAKYNEDNGTNVEVIGWDKAAQNGQFSGDFDDQAKGKELTNTMISQGADVIMPVAGPVGLGAAAAAKDAGNVVLVWVDADGYETTEYGDLMLTSAMKLMGEAVFEVIKSVKDDKFTSDPYVGTLENGGVALAPLHDFESKVPADLVKAVDDLKAKVISGEIKVDSPSSPK
ncbi:MAG: BMP family ABC transporter substrate-binding protein [Bifidobacteriaceae bacterium]|jgi:basic membrane protein A|nr:BMP family ABC transporter substrate-binding protein [Bifidobacteriaceae bacterium]